MPVPNSVMERGFGIVKAFENFANIALAQNSLCVFLLKHDPCNEHNHLLCHSEYARLVFGTNTVDGMVSMLRNLAQIPWMTWCHEYAVYWHSYETRR